MSRRVKSNRSPFVKAAVLGVALVLALIFYSRVPETIQRINELLVRVDAGGETVADTLLEAQKDSVRARFAGFWTYEGSGGARRPNVEVDDRIELKDNGIIWRVLTETLSLPSGRSFRHTTIEHSYLVPFAQAAADSESVQCQVSFIKRSRLFGGDTCYDVVVEEVVSGFNNEVVELRESTVWEVARVGGTLAIGGLAYEPYGDRDLAEFFPPGAIDIVDAISIRACRKNEGKRAVMRAAITEDLGKLEKEGRSEQSVREVIDGYYVPQCLRPMLVELAGGGKPPVEDFEVKLGIGPEGRVVEAKLSGGGLSFNESLKKGILEEIAQWRFRPVDGEAAVRTVQHTIDLR